MAVNDHLNTKEITKCTIRFYDPEFVEKLNDLYQKVGGTQSSFLGMLIKEGYKTVSPLYANKEVPVSESVKRVREKETEEALKELRDLLLEKSDVELKSMDGISEDQQSLIRLLSCVYNVLLQCLIGSGPIKDLADSGGFDDVPKRFRKEVSARQ